MLTSRSLLLHLVGLITCVMPMYLTELAPTPLRGPMGVLCPLGVTLGVLIGQIMGLSDLLGKTTTLPAGTISTLFVIFRN